MFGKRREWLYVQFVLLEVLAQFSCHLFQVAQRDAARPFSVKELECSSDLVERISCEDELFGCATQVRREEPGNKQT